MVARVVALAASLDHRPRELRHKLTPEDVQLLSQKLRDTCGWHADPKPFQLAGIKAQLDGDDMIIQASTGAGKTAIAAGPHLWQTSAGKTTIMVCPLLSLEDEMVRTFELEFGLNAVALNSTNGACSPLTIKRIISGAYHIILISPEMLQSRTFVNRVLRNPRFARRVLSVVVDEAHCISHWGAEFRKKYSSIGVVRAFLSRGTPIVALSATLTPRVRRDVTSKLHFPKGGDHFLNVSNDRSNVSLVVRACEHPMNTYADLDFVVPGSISSIEDIPKAYIYADNIHMGSEIVDYLKGLVVSRMGASDSSEEHATGAIRPFNAIMSNSYREESMDAFRRGTVRILVCTDAAGMGCNIRDVDLVVQWKLPATLSNFIQRAGRAAWASSRQGLAVLLVERSAFSTPDAKSARQPHKTQGGRRGAVTTRPTDRRKQSKMYAEAHGLKRGSHSGNDDEQPSGEEPQLDPDAADEGLLAFVQSVHCRRDVWSMVYESTHQDSTTPCCDLTRPGPHPRLKRTKKVKKGLPVVEYQGRLRDWCKTVFERDHSGAQWDHTGLLSHMQVEHLTSVGRLNRVKLASILGASWVWWDEYSDELLAFTEEWLIPTCQRAIYPCAVRWEHDAPAVDNAPEFELGLNLPPIAQYVAVLHDAGSSSLI
ncbi:P-loop containing nucleoside triphosphate hydrolase protein [Lenzites betulinus]|nr:P-loop containing nucleoside triphosphate hydrolase protein [Lenzites betulinus]